MHFGDLRILRYWFFVPRKVTLALFDHAPGLYQLEFFWLTNITGKVRSSCLWATTSEYLAEHLGVDKRDLARAVFPYPFRARS
jgi:hypothetical protein